MKLPSPLQLTAPLSQAALAFWLGLHSIYGMSISLHRPAFTLLWLTLQFNLAKVPHWAAHPVTQLRPGMWPSSCIRYFLWQNKIYCEELTYPVIEAEVCCLQAGSLAACPSCTLEASGGALVQTQRPKNQGVHCVRYGPSHKASEPGVVTSKRRR